MPDDDNTDGIYIVNYPDGENYRKVIDDAFNVIDGMRDVDLEDFEKNKDDEWYEDTKESIEKAKEAIKGSELKLEDLIGWYEAKQGCSLGSLLDFICETKEGWSYEEVMLDGEYDMDYGSWS